jgi:anti-sigma regulatory factor (Ser/Thr protein kinase)
MRQGPAMTTQAHNVQLELPSEPSAPAAARSCVDGLGLPGGLTDRARLLASELVANSVRHAGAGAVAPISVSVHLDAARLRVDVDDLGRGEVRVGSEQTRREGSGFGLFLVDAMSDRWGTFRRPDGTTVWFELDLVDTPTTDASASVTR